MKTLFKDATVITMDDKRDKEYDVLDIVVWDNIISFVGKNYDGDYDKLINCSGKVIMPGLINAHTHLGMSVFRNTNENLSLIDWLNNKTWPAEAKMSEDDIYTTTLLSTVEMILTGTTTCFDHYIASDITIKAIEESNIRCLYTNFLRDNDGYGNERLKKFINLYEKYNNQNELISFCFAPHSMYSCSKNYLKKISFFASKYNLPVHMHYCESINEYNIIRDIYKKDVADALKETNLTNNKLILAHGVYLSDEELDKLKKYDISIVHNPLSNLVLGSGICDVKNLIDKNINVCLGTDGAGSAYNINMFYHMQYVDLLQKGMYRDANIMNSYDVLKMATINGAKAINMDNLIGSIEQGKLADIIMLDLSDITIFPENNLISQIVHNISKNNIIMTMVNGKILAMNGKLNSRLNINKLRDNVNLIINKIF